MKRKRESNLILRLWLLINSLKLLGVVKPFVWMGLGFPAQLVMSILREVRMPADERWGKEIFKHDLYIFKIKFSFIEFKPSETHKEKGLC